MLDSGALCSASSCQGVPWPPPSLPPPPSALPRLPPNNSGEDTGGCFVDLVGGKNKGAVANTKSKRVKILKIITCVAMDREPFSRE